MIGVNSDKDREELKAAVVEQMLPWRSFWDGSTTGPIATKWNVRSWPTLFVIDHQGVIRVKYREPPGVEVLEAMIERFVGEAGP
jgi:hypothetical protein